MLRLTLSSINAHKGRLALTLLAISLSVGFVTASFVLADSLRSVFGDISSSIYDDVDAAVQSGDGSFDQLESGERFAQSELNPVAEIEGVASIEPNLGAANTLFTIDDQGDPLRPTGPPVLTFSFSGETTSAFTVVEGSAPTQEEIAIDTAQADVLGVGLGDTVSVATPNGVETFTVSALTIFGDFESGVSPYFLLFELSTMQRLLDAPGMIDGAALVFEDGADRPAVIANVSAVLPDGLFLSDQADLVAAQEAEFGELIDIIQTALLVFAGITAFVATFVIANTFAVLVGQQTRQIGLLRSIGASGIQAGGVVVAEAAVVGLLATGVGIGAGLLVAEGIKALFAAATPGGFPDGPTIIALRTIIMALFVGVGVTIVSALLPARRAARTSPLEALRQTPSTQTTRGPIRRGILARLVAIVAAPVARFGPAGGLAAGSVQRNPQRIVTTAMSMIVGLGLITTMAVLTSSYRSTLNDQIASDYDADLILTGADGLAIPFAAFEALSELPEVEAVSGFGATEVLVDDEIVEISSYQPTLANGVVDLGIIDGDHPVTTAEAMVDEEFANTQGVGVGDALIVEFSDGHQAPLVITGLFTDHSVATGQVLVDEAIVADHARNIDARLGAVRLAPETDPTIVAAALDNFPQVEVDTLPAHLEAREAQAQQLLVLVNGLLGLTIVIAMTGIANTIALTVLERSRELGLLRAVGMSRRQLRSMVRHEALITSTVGSVLGISIGIVIAAIAVPLLPDEFVSGLTIPPSIAVYLVAGIALGVLAAVLPAYRASRLRILDALAD